MHRIELSPKEQQELSKVTAEFIRRANPSQGRCAGCGRELPMGYLPVVTRWGSTNRSGIPVMVALEMFCQNCGIQPKSGGKVARKQIVPEPERAVPAPEASQPALTAEEIALRLYRATSSTPHNSQWLAARAGLEYGDYVKVILGRFRDAGKLVFNGKWSRPTNEA